MRKALLITMAVLAVLPARGTENCVVVRMDGSIEVPHKTLQAAQLMNIQLYGEIGIRLKWEESRRRKSSGCVEIRMVFASGSPSEYPGALAWATPYADANPHIHIFINRVLQAQRTGALAELYLAHVMAHEIGHILESVNRHSEDGVMKSHTPQAHALRERLKFAKEDVPMIHAGLARRMAAVNSGK